MNEEEQRNYRDPVYRATKDLEKQGYDSLTVRYILDPSKCPNCGSKEIVLINFEKEIVGCNKCTFRVMKKT